MAGIPILATGRRMRVAGVSAEGIRSASAASICWRSARVEGMANRIRLMFAYNHPLLSNRREENFGFFPDKRT
jgi:hypothetical protein